MMKKIVFILSLLACQSTVFAQLGVGTNSPDASAQLDVTATDKGFLAPRIALTSATDVTTIASPATGLLIYNTATAGISPNNVIPGYYYYNGTNWTRIISTGDASKWTNNASNALVNLTNLSDGQTPRSSSKSFVITDSNVLLIGDTTNISSPSIPERGILTRKTGNSSITSISDGGIYSVFENQIYGGSVIGSASYSVYAKSRGSLANPQAVQNGDLVGVLDFRANSGPGFGNGARLMTRVEGAVVANSTPISFDFQTVAPGEFAPVSRLKIASNGNVGIGNMSPSSKLEIASGISGTSGLRFTNLTSSSAATSASSKVLAVNSSGDLILTNVPGTQNIVTFNTADPNAGSPTFTPNTPIDQSVIYQSATNNSLWIYNGTTYVTYTPPTTTPFFLASSSNDAGSNKTLPINRTGSITVDNGFVRASNSSSLNIITIDPTETSGPRVKLGTTTTINSFLEIGAYNSQNNFDTKNRDLQFFGTGTGNSVGMMLKANTGFLGIGTTSPVSNLHVNSLLAATNTINANARVLRLSRPRTNGLKWDNIAQFNLGSYLVSGNAHSRLDLMMNDADTTLIPAPVMTWQANGRVGIGTTAPTQALTIQGGLNIDNGNLNTGTTANSLLFGAAGSGEGISSTRSGSNNQFGLNLLTNGIQRLVVTNAGNVGVGTTNPTTTLHVQNPLLGTATVNTDAQVLRLSRNGTPNVKYDNIAQFNLGSFSTAAAADSRLDLVMNNITNTLLTTPVMTWHANGRVGVNATAPQSALDVASSFVDVARFTTSQTLLNYAGIGIGNASGSWAKIAAGNDRFQIRNFSTDAVFLNVHLGNGNVGVGTINPTSKLEVNGSATNTTAFSAGAGTAIDYSNSNLAYTTANAGSFTLSNIKDGGTYTLAVQGSSSGTASFTCTGFTFYYVNNGITAPNKHTLYTFIVMGTNVYVYMATGF
jgi:hypothetical protein